MVRTLVPLKTLTRSDIATLLLSRFPDHPLSLRQVANLMNLSRHEARNAVQNLGGDMVAVVQRLTELKAADDRWVVHFEIDTVTKEFCRLFFMTPT